ncbi:MULTISPECIES: hypothetical protein [unclassified Saccharothrix]|uniref:hypothetical protein n=1 Tax=unclassified Saccharothrix TaxID=2593673 RepID=UPI00307E38BC
MIRRRSLLRTGALPALFGLILLAPTAVAHEGDDSTSSDGTIDNAKVTHAHEQHGGDHGHLPATSQNVRVVGKAAINQDFEGRVADVGVHNGYVSVTPSVGNNLSTAGGATLVDVTDPKRPNYLAKGFGDLDPAGQNDPGIAHEVHSAFIWDVGDKAYAVLVDDEEQADVDVFDITDPRTPVKIAEYDLAEMFPQILQAGPDNLTEVFLHDMVVKPIGGRQVMLLSYWDAGYVQLDVTDPTAPVYLADSDFANPDPELLESTGIASEPEGNAHQAEFTRDDKYVIAADEDFDPYVLKGSTDDGTSFSAGQGDLTPQLASGQTITGTAVYVGRACAGDAAVPAAPAVGTAQLAVVTRGACAFTEKVAAVTSAGGYEGVVVVNREGSCGAFGMSVEGSVPAFSVDRRTGFGLFDREGAYDEAAWVHLYRNGRPVGARGRDLARARRPGLLLLLRGRFPRGEGPAEQAGRGGPVRRRGREQLLGRPGVLARRQGVRGRERPRLRHLHLRVHQPVTPVVGAPRGEPRRLAPGGPVTIITPLGLRAGEPFVSFCV